MKIKSVKQIGAIALLGVIFTLSGCAEKAIDVYKNGCKIGEKTGEYQGSYTTLANLGQELLYNDCLEVSGAYRQQKDRVIGLGKRDDKDYRHYVGVELRSDYSAYNANLRINDSKGVDKGDKAMSEKYLQMAVQQLRVQIAQHNQGNPHKCYLIPDGAALNILRDELHKLQLGCIEENSSLAGEYIIYDTPSFRATLYQYADFAPKQIEEALRKDYPLRAEFVSKACKLYGDKYIAVDFNVAHPENIRRYCNEAQEIYAKGGSYNGVQVFAPNPNHQNVKLAQNAFNAVHNAIKQDELEEKKAEERQRQAEEAKERKYRESIMAPIARDCQGKFKNKEICHIFKHKLLEFHFAREGSQYEADEIFRDLKDYVTKLSPKKLKAMEQELSSKKNLTYKGESYCRWSEPFVWWGLKYQNETDWSLKKSWARVCNFHQDVVLESPFYE